MLSGSLFYSFKGGQGVRKMNALEAFAAIDKMLEL